MSNLIQAAESHYKSQMDKYALCLNACMGSDHPDLEKFLGSVEKYEQALINPQITLTKDMGSTYIIIIEDKVLNYDK